MKLFEGCRREYYYSKYHALCRDRHHVRALKNMTSAPLLAGSLVHEVIARALSDRYKYGRAPSPEQVTDAFRRRYEEAVARSADCADPAAWSDTAEGMLAEHYYSETGAAETIRAAGEKGAAGLRSLCAHSLWRKLNEELAPENIKYMDKPDDFPSFEYEGIRVYAKIDLAVCGRSWYRIFDWKTGRPGDADPLQPAIYALYAQSEWRWEPEKVQFDFVYLSPEVRRVRAVTDAESLREARETIAASFEEMVRLYRDGSPVIEDFPQNISPKCQGCRFRELCSV